MSTYAVYVDVVKSINETIDDLINGRTGIVFYFKEYSTKSIREKPKRKKKKKKGKSKMRRFSEACVE